MCFVTAHFRFALQFAQHSLADWCLKTVDEFQYVPVVSAQHLLVRFFYCAQISPFLLVASPAAFHVISSVLWLAQSPWPGQKSIVMC